MWKGLFVSNNIVLRLACIFQFLKSSENLKWQIAYYFVHAFWLHCCSIKQHFRVNDSAIRDLVGSWCNLGKLPSFFISCNTFANMVIFLICLGKLTSESNLPFGEVFNSDSRDIRLFRYIIVSCYSFSYFYVKENVCISSFSLVAVGFSFFFFFAAFYLWGPYRKVLYFRFHYSITP